MGGGPHQGLAPGLRKLPGFRTETGPSRASAAAGGRWFLPGDSARGQGAWNSQGNRMTWFHGRPTSGRGSPGTASTTGDGKYYREGLITFCNILSLTIYYQLLVSCAP